MFLWNWSGAFDEGIGAKAATEELIIIIIPHGVVHMQMSICCGLDWAEVFFWAQETTIGRCALHWCGGGWKEVWALVECHRVGVGLALLLLLL